MKKKMTRKNLPKKVLKNVMKKSSETPMNKGRKPNKTQERKREEKYYFCCKQQQQYWQKKECFCCCLCWFSNVGCCVWSGLFIRRPTSRFCFAQGFSLFSPRLASARPTGELPFPHVLRQPTRGLRKQHRGLWRFSSGAFTSGLLSAGQSLFQDLSLLRAARQICCQ